jgi:hypothetical protein
MLEMLFGKQLPPGVKPAKTDDLYAAAGTRGVFLGGDAGTGKTRYASAQLYKRFKANPKITIFVFDWSGGITNTILDLISRDPDHEKLLERVVLKEVGNEEYVCPTPEFHPDYGLSEEENVNRVVENLVRLAEFMSKTAGFLSEGAIRGTGKHLLRLLQVIRNEHGESWQITEGSDLIMDENLLKRAVAKFGGYAIRTKEYFEKRYLPKDVMPPHEKELTTRSLDTIFGAFDNRVMRAMLGYFKPMWSPKWATEHGQLVLFDYHKMINLPPSQHYAVVQDFSLVMNWINKREVDDPANERIIITIDEIYALLQISGFAQWLSMISPLYRSRATELMLICQGFWQLDERLYEQVWSMGSTIFFRRDDVNEAKIIAEQLWSYQPTLVKNPPKTSTQNATTEPVSGQDRMNADWIQNLEDRQFVMRQYVTEQKKEKGVLFVRRTADLPTTRQFLTIKEIKDRLIKKYGVPIRDALEVTIQRKIPEQPKVNYNARKITQ